MNMDYSKAFRLLSQDVELMQRNKQAEKAVHDNLYNKGFRDGIAILNKIEPKCDRINSIASVLPYTAHREIQELLCEIMDLCKAEIEPQESEDKE